MMDAYDLWTEKERERLRWLKKRPICYHCCQHIQDEEMFVIDGNFWHVDCAEQEFKKSTEDYIEE